MLTTCCIRATGRRPGGSARVWCVLCVFVCIRAHVWGVCACARVCVCVLCVCVCISARALPVQCDNVGAGGCWLHAASAELEGGQEVLRESGVCVWLCVRLCLLYVRVCVRARIYGVCVRLCQSLPVYMVRLTHNRKMTLNLENAWFAARRDRTVKG